MERLRLLCAADRTRLRLVWRLPPQSDHPAQTAGAASGRGGLASMFTAPLLVALLPLLPGSLGRWSRRLRAGVGFFRTVARTAL
jgi:hypothetical protein